MMSLDLGAYAPERAYSVLLLNLNELIEKGDGDSHEADALRDEMSGYWSSFTEDQRQRMRWLSEDLADLAKGGPSIVHTSPDAIGKWKNALNAALVEKSNGKHDDYLAVLRSPARTKNAASDLLFLQAGAWDDAGFPEVAIQLLKGAEKQDPSVAIYTLIKLAREGYSEEAVERADILLNERSDEPVAVYFASAVLLGSVRYLDPIDARPTLERITGPLRNCVAAFSSSHPIQLQLPGFGASMAKILGLCLEWLGKEDAAIKVYDRVLASNPNDPDILTMRGLARMKKDYQLALIDLRHAIQNNTSLPWPYFVVSRECLGSHNFEAVKLCNYALNLKPTPSDAAKSLLYEGIAVGYALMDQPRDRVLEYFYLAIDLDPHDERIRNKLELYVKQSGDFKEQLLAQAKQISHAVIRSAATRLSSQFDLHPDKTNEDRILRSLAA
jgi:tetratricopeptide (TPR) repeat protein